MTRLTEQLLLLNPDRVYSATDLANLVQASPDARHSLLKRALVAGEIIRIRRGLYVLSARFRGQTLEPFCLAQRIYGPSYVSLESALGFHGWIPEAVYATTCACLKKSRSYDTPVGFFQYATIPQRILFAGVERLVFGSGEAAFIATPLKALADYVYLRKLAWTGLSALVEDLRIEREAFAPLVAKDFELVAGNSTSARVKLFLSALRKELGL